MQRTKFVFAFLLGMANMLLAAPTPPMPLTNNTEQSFCVVLASPASLDIVSVTPTTITYSWPVVTGAYAYRLETKNFMTGNIVDVQTISAALIPRAMVVNLLPNTTYQTSIQSVDENGVLSQPPTAAPPVHTLIFEIVASLYPAISGIELNCEMGYTPETGGPYTLDGSFTYYRVVNTNNQAQKIFRVNVSPLPTTKVWPNQGPNDPFQITLSPPFSDHIIISYLGKPKVSITTNLQTSPSNIRLYRDGQTNDPAFKVYYWGCSNLQDQGRDSRTQDFDDSNITQSLSANPNPFSDQLEVFLPFSTENQEVFISLYDLQGRQILNQTVPGGTQTMTLPTEQVTPGLYFLRAQSGDLSEIIRVLKTQ